MNGRRNHGNDALLIILGFGVPFLLLVLFWALFIRSAYYPSGDEVALLVASARMFQPSMAAWFTDGFRHYFIAYPGMPHLSTDFIRPVANLTYYINSVFFSTHWAYYLLFSYMVQAGLVFVSVRLAMQVLLFDRACVAIVGLLVFLSPAFGSQAIYSPSFLFDLLAALFVMLALERLWTGRYVTAWVLLFFAVFTKETALLHPSVSSSAPDYFGSHPESPSGWQSPCSGSCRYWLGFFYGG